MMITNLTQTMNTEMRYNHDECGDTRSRLYVKRTQKGFIYHCHNCGHSGFSSTDGCLTPSETLRCLTEPQQYQEVEATKLYLPDDFTTDIPDRGKVWLLKYGITMDEARHYKMGSYQSGNRLFLGVFDSNNNLVYFQGRYLGTVDKYNPKYLNVKAKGARDVYFRSGSGRILCVVEDILSAIKVGRHVSGLALLGSYIPLSLINILNEGYDKVYIWLDPDKQKEAVKYSKLFGSMIDCPVIPILLDKDPKEYTNHAICTRLGC